MATFRAVCRVEDVAEGRGLAVEVDGLRVAVFNDGGRFHVLLGRCPHANGPLGLGWIEEGEAVCPLHHWRFRLDTGRCTTVRGESVHCFRCEVRADEVYVEV
jgi:nitrite reductase (NADH) small subunit